MKVVESNGLHYSELNKTIRKLLTEGYSQLRLSGVNGQRYIGCGIEGEPRLFIEGTAGNNLGAMMDGPVVHVHGNAQDGLGNTMNNGRIVVWGSAGDIVGYGMRGGTVLIKENVGWRVGIHMKGNEKKLPVIIIGGSAGDFLGEYMAGGVIVVLGLNVSELKDRSSNPLVGNYVASGMHGGEMYIRGKLTDRQLTGEVEVDSVVPNNCEMLKAYIEEYASEFDVDCTHLKNEVFSRIRTKALRPYAHLYNHSI